MVEEWRPIPEYEGLYAITRCGKVKRLQGYQAKTERILKPRLSGGLSHYVIYTLSKDGKPKTQGLHRLLLQAFIGPPPTPEHECNHIDGNPLNNSLDNLEWVTASENIQHMLRLGLRCEKRGAEHYAAKMTQEQAFEIKQRYAAGESAAALGGEYGVRPNHVKDIGRGVRWKHLPYVDCGERGRHMMKLTRSKVEEMRTLRQQGWTIKRLAERFNVSTTTVVHTVNGKYHNYGPSGTT